MDLFESIKFLRGEAAGLCRKFLRSHPGTFYCDIRFEVVSARFCSAEYGAPLSSSDRHDATIGVSVHASHRGDGHGFAHSGASIGCLAASRTKLIAAIRAGLEQAYERARLSARENASTVTTRGKLAGILDALTYQPRESIEANIAARFNRDPREVTNAELGRIATDASAEVRRLGSEIVYDHISATTELREELFASSEGSTITQGFAISQGDAFVVAQSEDGHQEIWDTIGQQAGIEALIEGWRSELIPNPDIRTFATELGREAINLARAPLLKPPDGEVTVVTDPHFNALLAHEIVGHPSEADRALKMEAAYAGRSWFLRSLTDNEIGRQVGAPILSACSDPSLEGYGHYRYDHEGMPGRKVMHIERGIFRGFLNSRATAAAMGVETNGAARATEARMVPLIRMNNTFFMPGNQKPHEIIGEVEHGYYVCGNLVPSIAESRENFRISARRIFEIENGRIGRLYRSGSVMADSRSFFLNVDAVGDDLLLIAIPNCGKGQPMQAKRMANGGPTLRSRARLAGANRG